MLDAVDPHGTTMLAAAEMSAPAAEVDALLATVPERDRGAGHRATAWRGLSRFRVMVGLCRNDPRFTLHFLGD